MRPLYTNKQKASIQFERPADPQSSEPVSSPGTTRLSGWVLLPLRLFLGVTFSYAGMQKLTDPQFFQPATPGYIGNQIIAFAHGSPLHDFLMQYAVAHAQLSGWLIIAGEIAIGLATLCGLLFRPATFFGIVLNILFFLTASWHVYPYFYGADIVFAFCWLTLFLNGPLNTGLPSIDGWLCSHFISPSPRQYTRLLLALLVGMPGIFLTKTDQRSMWGPVTESVEESRRSFIVGALTGGASAIVLTVFAYSVHLFGFGAAATNSTNLPDAPPTALPDTPGAVQAGNTPTVSKTITRVSAVPRNSAFQFTLPSTGDPGLLIHLPSDKFVAYDATCTHAGCPVDYDPDTKHLICPCHGAEYDPAQGAQVLRGPTTTPLTSVAIQIDSATGTITLQ